MENRTCKNCSFSIMDSDINCEKCNFLLNEDVYDGWVSIYERISYKSLCTLKNKNIELYDIIDLDGSHKLLKFLLNSSNFTITYFEIKKSDDGTVGEISLPSKYVPNMNLKIHKL